MTDKVNDQRKAKLLADFAVKKYLENPGKRGILFCEGTYNSIDVFLYSRAYPELIVIPCEGCSNITKLAASVFKRVKKHVDTEVFAIIDRDDLTKKKIRALKKKGIYCTVLPFIENILCCPEVLKILCTIYDKDYFEVRSDISSGLLESLHHRIQQYLPINFDCSEWQQSSSITIIYKDSSGTVRNEKVVTRDNILYVYRSKEIVGQVGNALGILNRDTYYSTIKTQLKGEHGKELLAAMVKYLPEIKLKM